MVTFGGKMYCSGKIKKNLIGPILKYNLLDVDYNLHIINFYLHFSYDSCLENQSDSIGVRFDDLHLCRYSSCVTDILYFLFTTVDCDVRRDHAFNFIAAYYDHFNKVLYN